MEHGDGLCLLLAKKKHRGKTSFPTQTPGSRNSNECTPRRARTHKHTYLYTDTVLRPHASSLAAEPSVDVHFSVSVLVVIQPRSTERCRGSSVHVEEVEPHSWLPVLVPVVSDSLHTSAPLAYLERKQPKDKT